MVTPISRGQHRGGGVATDGKAKAQRISCTNNLKQDGLSFRTFAIDNDGNMPQVSGRGPGRERGYRRRRQVVAANQNASRGVSKMFLTMSNELSTPKILYCPAEYESATRQPSSSLRGGTIRQRQPGPYTNDLNVSYFIGVDAKETYPQMFLTGDHNLGSGNPPTMAYQTAVAANASYAVSLGTNFPANNAGVGWMDNHACQTG